MRLVLYVNTFPKLSETFIVSKFIGLLRLGYDVHVYCRYSNSADWNYFPELRTIPNVKQRVHVQPAPSPKWRALLQMPLMLAAVALSSPQIFMQYIRRFGKNAAKQLYLDGIILRLQPDILHFEFGATAPGQIHIKDMLNCKVVVSFRGYDLNFVALDEPNYYDSVWQQADWLHLLGNDLWNRAKRRGCPPDKPHTLVPPAIDTSLFSPKDRSVVTDDPITIVSVGRLEWKKGYEFALSAVNKLGQKGVKFRYIVIGAGSYHGPLNYAIYEMKLGECVEFKGALPRTEVMALLQEADIFLHAAVSEGFSNAVLEAQAMQLPVVTSDADGLSENVVDGKTGFVVPRRDADALAEKLFILAQEPALRQQMGEAGRKRVLEHFDLKNQPPQFAGIYDNVMNMTQQPVSGGVNVTES